MPRPKPPYPVESKARMIDLVRLGRTVRSLSREFGVTETTIHSWVRQDDRGSGRRKDGRTTEEQQISPSYAGETPACARSATY